MGMDYLCSYYHPQYGICVLGWCRTSVVTIKEKAPDGAFFNLLFRHPRSFENDSDTHTAFSNSSSALFQEFALGQGQIRN